MENKTKIMIGVGVVVTLGAIAYLTRKKWLPKKASSFSNMEDEVATTGDYNNDGYVDAIDYSSQSQDLNSDGYVDAMDYAYGMGASEQVVNNPLPIAEKNNLALVMAMADATQIDGGDMTMADVVATGGSDMTMAEIVTMADSLGVDVPVAITDVVQMGGGDMTMAEVVAMSDTPIVSSGAMTMAEVLGIEAPIGSDMGSEMVMANVMADLVDKAENKVEAQMGNATILSSSGGDNLGKLVADMGSAEQIMSKPVQQSVLIAKDLNKNNPNTPNFTPKMPSKRALIRSKLTKGVARVKSLPTAKKVAIALALGGGAGLLLRNKIQQKKKNNQVKKAMLKVALLQKAQAKQNAKLQGLSPLAKVQAKKNMQIAKSNAMLELKLAKIQAKQKTPKVKVVQTQAQREASCRQKMASMKFAKGGGELFLKSCMARKLKPKKFIGFAD